MLTPDEMLRIEEEERKRHAEEQYRATVRSNLQNPVGESINWPSKKSDTKPPTALMVLGGILAAIVILVFVCNFAVNNMTGEKAKGDSSPTTIASAAAPTIRYEKQTNEIASGNVMIQRGGYIDYRIEISPSMRNPVVWGNFTATGGFGNDVLGVIATETDYLNWINGHPARAFWSTPGKVTAGNFYVKLAPGTYYLALSNRFSPISDKFVSLSASVTYQAQVLN